MKYSFVNTIGKVTEKIYSEAFLDNSRISRKDFTRDRKMSFTDYIFFILSNTKKSLQSALFAFMKEMKTGKDTYSKQAFSKGRNRIKAEAFLELFNILTKSFYEDADYSTFKGYRVSAIDGTKYNLPYSEELLSNFGMQKTANMVQSLGSCLYDVLNGIMLDVRMCRVDASERDIAVQHLTELEKIATEKELILMDRGYPASGLFEEIDKAGFKYISRCEPNFIKGMKLNSDDEVITYTFCNTKITLNLRVVKITLDNGNTETLVTNLLDKDFTKEDLKQLYSMRWCIEECYKNLKTKLQIENFSGTSKLAVLQDFYATMFLANCVGMIDFENRLVLQDKNTNAKLKHEYKLNTSMIISSLKLNVIEMVSTKSNIKRRKIYNSILSSLKSCLVAVVPNRHFPRVRKHPSCKFPISINSL